MRGGRRGCKGCLDSVDICGYLDLYLDAITVSQKGG